MDHVDNETEAKYEPQLDKRKQATTTTERNWIRTEKVAERKVDLGVQQTLDDLPGMENVEDQLEDGTIVDEVEEVWETEEVLIEEWDENGWTNEQLPEDGQPKVVKWEKREASFKDCLSEGQATESTTTGSPTTTPAATGEEEMGTTKFEYQSKNNQEVTMIPVEGKKMIGQEYDLHTTEMPHITEEDMGTTKFEYPSKSDKEVTLIPVEGKKIIGQEFEVPTTWNPILTVTDSDMGTTKFEYKSKHNHDVTLIPVEGKKIIANEVGVETEADFQSDTRRKSFGIDDGIGLNDPGTTASTGVTATEEMISMTTVPMSTATTKMEPVEEVETFTTSPMESMDKLTTVSIGVTEEAKSSYTTDLTTPGTTEPMSTATTVANKIEPAEEVESSPKTTTVAVDFTETIEKHTTVAVDHTEEMDPVSVTANYKLPAEDASAVAKTTTTVKEMVNEKSMDEDQQTPLSVIPMTNPQAVPTTQKTPEMDMNPSVEEPETEPTPAESHAIVHLLHEIVFVTSVLVFSVTVLRVA